MGCTSSAQNMAPSLASSDKDPNMLEEMDKNFIKEERTVVHENSSELNGIQVLPPCDNLDEPTHLDSHNKLVDTGNVDFEQDSYANAHVKESEVENVVTMNSTMDTSKYEERLSHLEEVVEKVVELYDNGELQIPTETEQANTEGTQKNTKEVKDEIKNQNQENSEQANDTTEESEAEEAASPSQSQSSRATRWEALADIAAELPPSLAVDPVTGQIYALSK